MLLSTMNKLSTPHTTVKVFEIGILNHVLGFCQGLPLPRDQQFIKKGPVYRSINEDFGLLYSHSKVFGSSFIAGGIQNAHPLLSILSEPFSYPPFSTPPKSGCLEIQGASWAIKSFTLPSRGISKSKDVAAAPATAFRTWNCMVPSASPVCLVGFIDATIPELRWVSKSSWRGCHKFQPFPKKLDAC